MYDQNNIFAKILRGEIPCKKFYEDDVVLSFYDINPLAETHLLVIPKASYVSFADMVRRAGADDVHRFFLSLQKVVNKVDQNQQGHRLVTNEGSFQEVPHMHFHLLLGKMCRQIN